MIQVNFCIRYEVAIQLNSIAYGHPVVLAPFFAQTILSPLNCLGTLVKTQLAINVKFYFLSLNSFPFTAMSILMAVLQCLVY